MDFSTLLIKFNGNPPANPDSLAAVQHQQEAQLPADYLELLRFANGGEGFIGDTYVILWRAEELGEMNSEYQVSTFAPGLFLFGTNGGGEAFGFDLATGGKQVISVPFIPLAREEAIPKGETFTQFIENL